MSATRQQGIDVNQLLQQLAALEEYIKALQASIERVNASLQVLYAGEKALEELRNGDVDAFVDADGGGVIYVHAKIPGGENTRVVVHAGLDVFIEVPIQKALEIVRDRQAELAKLLDRYRRELASAVATYQQLRSVLEQALRAAQSQ